jgi:NADH:ubiquinone oxidoreductase subunit F (NADH-binding)/(2Fe-2S) ferredoxin
MTTVQSVAALERWREAVVQARAATPRRVAVCGGRSCHTGESAALAAALEQEVNTQNLGAEAQVVTTGCPGFCDPGPLVLVLPERILYTRVAVSDAADVIAQTIGRKTVVERLLYCDPRSGERMTRDVDVPFYKGQHRVLLKLSGLIDPTRLDDYVAEGGYKGLARALGGLRADEVIDEIKRSGLRGRGGGGFPVGTKWELSRRAPGNPKYVVCNADEANPGAFQDRSLIGANPHAIIEGMIIGAYAVGASEGFIYLRHDHAATIEIVRGAIAQCRERGLLGLNILGSGFHFDLRVQLNAGAFVCGEETALIASIEGRAGEPRPRPPFPAQEGLWGKPTVINNAKTWATVPHILSNGAEWHARLGTARSKGTTVFSLNGRINNAGLVEVPMGVTLRHIIDNIGGGVRDGKRLKAVQPGGPSGGCIPERLLDLPIDYESFAEAGSMMGSGGLIVMDEDTCMVDVARYFTAFNKAESCGKCVACREGTRQMHAILSNITAGNGEEGDIELLEELGTAMADGALCGLGRAAPNPVLSTIRYFREEYEAHINEKRCPAGFCKMPILAGSA